MRKFVLFRLVQLLRSLLLELALPLGSMSVEKDLHKGLVGMEVLDVIPPTFKLVSRPSSGGSFSAYFFRIKRGDPFWRCREGALYSPDERLIVHSTLPPPLPRVWPPCTVSQSSERHDARVWRTTRYLWRPTVVRLTQCSVDSTSDADVAIVLAWVRLQLGC
ncbi:hypothetical protein BHE74_00046850 [Ensete ventricosum]|nr:hypothetical protein BHE74_00046850 [Ensete ventricosum]